MGFSLTIQEGKDLGRQFSFDQEEVTIGRTAENDVVLYDPGVSRKHVVIRTEEGRHIVQDQGSANGTQVNGNSVSEEELQPGDLLSVGPVVFAFEVVEGNSTRIVDNAAIVEQRSKRPVGKASSTQQLKTTSPIQSAKRPGNAGPKALATRPKNGAGGISPRPRPQAAPMLASERARLQRQNAGPLGKIKLLFMDAPRPVKLALIGVLVLSALAGFAVLVKRITNVKTVTTLSLDKSHDQFKLTESASKEIYGYGDEFSPTIQTKDELHFTFDFSENIPQVYYLKYEAMGVERKDQVDITLNGVHVAYVSPSMGDYTRAQRLKLPKKYLKASITNEIVFDEVDNPPNSAPWAITKAKLIIKTLPKCSTTDECVREAKKLYDQADLHWSQKGIASENSFLAYQELHKGLLFLEAVDPKPDLYSLATSTLRDIDRELDATCNRIMLTAKRYEEMKDEKTALKTYKDGMKWYPKAEDEHPCRGRIQEKIDEYGDAGPK